ncbi:MAG: DUF3187 family protein [Planctomycetes bacterium]|nr:DUF3187 family protein [Planctomycetota bacterium]
MRRLLVVSACAPAAWGCVASPSLRGPMPVRNQHPAQLTVLHLPTAATGVLPAGRTALRADAAYSSLFLSGANDSGQTWYMDGEYLRVGLGTRVGLGANLELGAELPFAHTTGGFLDSFLIAYHDLFGMPDQGRDATPRDQFEIEAGDQGASTWRVDRDDAALLDVPLTLTWRLADANEGLGLALRGGVELPTGNDRRGYGTGAFDYALGAVVEYRALGCGFYGHLQHTWAGTPASARDAGLRFADVSSVGLAAELPLEPWLCALLQVEAETSTLRHFGLPETDRYQVLLWAGLRFDLGAGWDLEVGFGEDLQTQVSPDFTAWLAMVWQPGGGGPP